MTLRVKVMSAPIVSVVVPVYNVPGPYLRKCIESLLNQTLNDIEIIIIDDGSKDDSGIICDEYALHDKRIKVIHKQNGGLSAARNTGCRAAIGCWITMVDGDDWLESEALEQASLAGNIQNSEIVLWGLVKNYKNRQEPYDYSQRFADGKLYCGIECRYIQEMLLHYNAQIATAYAKLIRRDFIIRYNIYHDEVLRQGAEGLEFCLRLLDSADRVLFLNQHWYHYVYNPKSISALSSETNNAYILSCFEKIYIQICDSEYKDRFLPWFYNRLLYVIVTTAISGYFHPDNPKSFTGRINGFDKFIKNTIISDSLRKASRKEMSKQRKMTLWLIQHRCYKTLEVLGVVRKKQKQEG